MVIPLVRAATPSWRFLEALNLWIFKMTGSVTLTPGRRYQFLLENGQRQTDVLPGTSVAELNTIYIIAGLMVNKVSVIIQ